MFKSATRFLLLAGGLSLMAPLLAEASVISRACEAVLQLASGRVEKVDPELSDKTDEQFLVRIFRSIDFKIGQNPDSFFRTMKEQKKISPYVVKSIEPHLYRSFKKIKAAKGRAMLMQQVELMADATQPYQTFFLVFRKGRSSPIGLIQAWVSRREFKDNDHQLNYRSYLFEEKNVREVFSAKKPFSMIWL